MKHGTLKQLFQCSSTLEKDTFFFLIASQPQTQAPSTAAPATHAPATAAPITQAPSTASTQPQTLQTRPSRTPSVRVGSGSSSSQPATHIQPQPGKDAYSLTFSKIEAERVA